MVGAVDPGPKTSIQGAAEEWTLDRMAWSTMPKFTIREVA